MADPADVTPPPAAPAPEPVAPHAEPSGTEAPLTYRPLSLTALAGLAVAAAYALLMVAGVLFLFLTRAPWLLPTWTFLIPVVAVFVCVLARVQIRSSEGVRSGL